jgi:hypothetical protein
VDRYEAPNDDETLVRVEPALRDAFEPLPDSAAIEVGRVGSSREPFAARVTIASPRPLEHWAEGSAALA